MLHLFLGKDPWFSAKRYGYGSGLPIRWQGWLVIGVYIAAMIGSGLLIASNRGGQANGGQAAAIIMMLVLTGLFMLICRKRTEGGWRWRSGGE